uniref:Uncharacterized protein n=1 Tax=Glossina pallidipes TaxID=7398 RepID=A0A1A9ZET4_GLOPL
MVQKGRVDVPRRCVTQQSVDCEICLFLDYSLTSRHKHASQDNCEINVLEIIFAKPKKFIFLWSMGLKRSIDLKLFSETVYAYACLSAALAQFPKYCGKFKNELYWIIGN